MLSIMTGPGGRAGGEDKAGEEPCDALLACSAPLPLLSSLGISQVYF